MSAGPADAPTRVLSPGEGSGSGDGDLAAGLARRVLSERECQYLGEVQRILDATYTILERQDNLNPSLREILRITNLSSQAFYRYFRSKDDLLLVILNDGCRRLRSYQEHRMQSASSPIDEIRQWMTAMLVQAADPAVAARTRPFVEDQYRLWRQFPEETRVGTEQLIELLMPPLQRLSGKSAAELGGDAKAIFQLTYGAMSEFIIKRQVPTDEQIESLVQFVMRAIA